MDKVSIVGGFIKLDVPGRLARLAALQADIARLGEEQDICDSVQDFLSDRQVQLDLDDDEDPPRRGPGRPRSR
ncbi:hypothetical protein [Blackfly microvirus SF02]|uniref:Uncharacterized protein n=1 Tax=Blackfly microvirus SF02 TaxID=2576452 RepID=A0A4P8PQ79_9VIRU|nr:hypothetical protein [Blackfly microvirus SF02]